MDSLNDIIEERKKSRTVKKTHSHMHSIPEVLRIQNSIDEEAVLIEKLNRIQETRNDLTTSDNRPPSRANEN